MTTPEREKFEKWWPTLGQTIGKVAAWEAWQAAFSAAPTPPEVEPPVYQIRLKGNTGWFDTLSQGFDSYSGHEDYERRILYTCPPSPKAEWPEIPEVIPYKSASIPESQWRKEPIDHWLKLMLDDCDHHEGIIIKATLELIENVRQKSPPKATYDADGNPLNLMAAAKDALRQLDVSSGYYHRATCNLRKFIGEKS